jgi:phenylacetate-CoA ligase
MNALENKTIQEIYQFQAREFQKLLLYLSQKSTFYQQHFIRHHIDIHNISLHNLSQIPPVSKSDLNAKNMDFLCVEKARIAEYCATSGTLGEPVTIALTANDLDRLAFNEYLSFLQMDCNSDDIFQLMLTMDKQFMAGIAYYLGIQKIGASAIRIGPGNIPMQWDSIVRNQPSVLIAVPSFILKLVQYAENHHFNLNDSSVKKILCIGESIRNQDFSYNELAKRILRKWNVQLFSTYASTEKQTAFTECSHGIGNHSHPELLIFEVLDINNQPLAPGQLGELTITTLGVEGMPLLRYKTGDICSYTDEPCVCGRNSFRISQIVGRNQQLIKFKGTTVYPSTIYNALNSIEEIKDYFIVLEKNELGTDELIIYLSVESMDDALYKTISEQIQIALKVLPTISFKSSFDILEMQSKISNRKINKFLDNRNN